MPSRGTTCESEMVGDRLDGDFDSQAGGNLVLLVRAL